MTANDAPMRIELDYLCDVCGRPVPDGGGCLTIHFADLNSYRTALAGWEQIHGDGTVHSLGQLLTHPDLVPWRIFHDRCAPEGCDGYDVDVSHIRTWQALAAQTARLMRKNWFVLTDWAQVIEAAADDNSTRIVPTRRGDAA